MNDLDCACARLPRRPARSTAGTRRIPFLLALLLSGCAGGVLDPHGVVGAAEREVTLNALAVMLVIVVPTILVAVAFAWWFRASNPRAHRRPQFAYSGRVELIVWSIPLLAIVFIGGLIWSGSHRLDPFAPLPGPARPLEVQVVSLDWKWLFIYPEQGVATVNQLVVPTGVPVHFSLTSGSVMNSFWVPQLGGMVATMNRMATQLSLQADDAGDYYGQSAQFSGDGFSGMHFLVHAVAADNFARWLNATRQAGGALDAASYAELARQSRDVQPFTYRSVQAGLFDAVVQQQIPPAGGPEVGHGGAAANPRTGS
ncbi:ubiquinol oxidase subunit II [Ramlibacter ginsenosidimutans]|uniref:Ubiquinol oxidase subunit 2 n=1 Tax=Ramlibacter ginsenosidimutans TaxID=502333 RepID=A0A934TTZ3_9BURK|nr:ubiquinol oxidase subunit II [Ramlibacter ginsenosidimutans]MBK6007333.1 ubiquinol oxidase subunit II [Ramlibacter ginsenosidimutans]